MPLRDLVLTGTIFALLPVCFLRPWFGILVWTWVSVMNPHRLTWSFAWDMEYAQMVAIAVLGGLLCTRDRRPVAWTPEMRLLLVLFAVMTFTTFFAWAPDSAWRQWEQVGKILLMVYVTTMLIQGKQRIYWLVLVAALSVGFYGFKGGLFTITTGGQWHVRGPEKTFLSGNNFLGLALVMILPLLLCLAQREGRTWLRALLYATFCLSFIAAPFTYSRGAMLGLAAVTPFLLFRFKKKFLILPLLVPLAFVAKEAIPEKLFVRAETIENYQEDTSAMRRIAAWDLAFRVALDNPLTGGGFNYNANVSRWFSYLRDKYAYLMRTSQAEHSIYFQVLGQHGFIGFGLFMVILFLTFRRLGRLKKCAADVPELQWISDYAWALRVGLVGYAVTGAFLNLAYFDLYYLFIALAAMMWREVEAYEAASGRTVVTRAGNGARRRRRASLQGSSTQAAGAGGVARAHGERGGGS